MVETESRSLSNPQMATINVANKIRNTSLSKYQGLMPLYELISNSIHAIEERKQAGLMTEGEKGRIIIRLIRNGDPKLHETLQSNDKYPIASIVVEDNGIGMDDDNLKSFTEADSDHKLSIGGKGLGRFVCLKAFKWLSVESSFKDKDGSFKKRFINLKNTRVGFEDFNEKPLEREVFKTVCTLHDFIDKYQKFSPKSLSEIAIRIITHFQLYYMRGEAPTIVVYNQNGESIELSSKYNTLFNAKITDKVFKIGENTFTVYLSKANSANSHRLHFCAQNRSVIDDWLGRYIIELGKTPIRDNDEIFYYTAFVVSTILDECVSNERTGFVFPDVDDEEDGSTEDISLSIIRKKAVATIESLISDYIEQVRNAKIECYRDVVNAEFPQYRAVLSHKEERVKLLPSDLNKQELDYELYKIEAEWKAEIKRMGAEILEQKKDVTTTEEYKQLYEDYLTEMNEIGQSELARYVVHRKSIIDLLDILTEREGLEDKYANEDLVHCVFFPIKSTSDVISYEKQNLWLLDERLSYHSYLASDKMFLSMDGIEVTENDKDRPDLLILNNAFAFSEDNDAPYQSISIVEFKKPERDNYVDNDEKKNPLDQVEQYVEDLLDCKVKNRKGRTINITERTPFYIYIVCDLTPSLIKILERRDFMKTPDGLGYYNFRNKRYNGFVLVLSYEKVKADARKRNQILFDKLGLPDNEGGLN